MSITTLNPPSPHTQSVEAERLARLFAESAATSIGSIDNRQIPLQLVPVYVANITKDVLSKLEEGCDIGLSEQIYENLTAAFKALQTAHSSPVEMQETVAKIGAIAAASLAPKAA
ncbi:MAG: hypothetical protein KBC88_03035 [Alphaproteobacteria bacterium]|nr:hypothetical protein [Alphaproteobacteria bacterium]